MVSSALAVHSEGPSPPGLTQTHARKHPLVRLAFAGTAINIGVEPLLICQGALALCHRRLPLSPWCLAYANTLLADIGQTEDSQWILVDLSLHRLANYIGLKC